MLQQDITFGQKITIEKLTDIFVLQDEITSKLITAMEVKLTFGEQARLWEGAGTTNILAYDKLMRGLDYYLRHTRQDNAQARKFVKEAIKIDKEYAFAYVILGFILLYDLFDGSGLFLQNAREFGKMCI